MPVEKVGLLEETPVPSEPHVNNYLELLGEAIKEYRKSHPVRGLRSAAQFTEKRLSLYFNSNVSRKTLSRLEKGDYKVSIGVLAATLQEMGAWPRFIEAVKSGELKDERYIKLVIEEIRLQEKEKVRQRMIDLQKNYFNEIK